MWFYNLQSKNSIFGLVAMQMVKKNWYANIWEHDPMLFIVCINMLPIILWILCSTSWNRWRRWQLGNPPRGTVNKFEFNCNAMKLKFIQYPSTKTPHSILHAYFFLLSSLWLSLSGIPFVRSAMEMLHRSNEFSMLTFIPERMVFSSSWTIKYVCPQAVFLSSNCERQMQKISVPKNLRTKFSSLSTMYYYKM